MSELDLFSEGASNSASYFIAVGLALLLLIEAAIKARQLRWLFAAAVYLTTALWYFIDPVYQPDGYTLFSIEEINFAFLNVIIFLISFRLLTGWLVPPTPTSILRQFDPRQLDRGPFIGLLMLGWAILFVAAAVHANYRVVEMLFPLLSRAGGVTMFARGRYGGSTGFLLASAGYSYMAICAAFGLVFACTRRPAVRLIMLFMMCLTWPMFILSGTRHKVLAVVFPTIIAMIFTRGWTRTQQIVFLVACGLFLNTAMLIAIEFRNDGIDKFFTEEQGAERLAEAKHLGLNMAEELLYIQRFQRTGQMSVEWGWNYLAHLANVIPRAIWEDKPFVGRELAYLRVGLHHGDVVATISYGFIGQGISNFGPFLGAVVPALMLALYGRWLCWLPSRGNRFLRISLVIFGLALIPNLGRDISLLVLWPAIFAYVGILLYERYFDRRMPPRRISPTMH